MSNFLADECCCLLKKMNICMRTSVLSNIEKDCSYAHEKGHNYV